MVFISVWLTLLINKYLCSVSVRPRLTNWKFGRDKFYGEFWKGQTNFVSPVRPDPNLGLIDMFSANQAAEIVACILLQKKLQVTVSAWF